MSDQTPEAPVTEDAEGLVQLRFADEADQISDLNAAELAEVLQGLVEFTSQMAKTGLFGEGPPPDLRVRPTREGSFILEAILHWAGANPEAAVGVAMPPAAGLAAAVRLGFRRLRSAAKHVEYLDNGNVMIEWSDNTVSEEPAPAWREPNKQKRASKRALRKILAPLGDDADRLEVRNGRAEDQTDALLATEPAAVGDREDYRAAAYEPDEVTEEVHFIDAEARLGSIDFRAGVKWRVETSAGTRQATIGDEDFLGRLDRGLALHKNDLFDVTIREVVTTRNERPTTEWTLTRVTRKSRGGDDDVDAPASRDDAPSP